MGEPQYRLEGIVRTRTEQMEDFEGPLDSIPPAPVSTTAAISCSAV